MIEQGARNINTPALTTRQCAVSLVKNWRQIKLVDQVIKPGRISFGIHLRTDFQVLFYSQLPI